jgi:serine/threonine protein kinase
MPIVRVAFTSAPGFVGSANVVRYAEARNSIGVFALFKRLVLSSRNQVSSLVLLYHCGPMPLAAHTRFGPYEILAPLGTGGMGEVFSARDTRLERTVAIKICKGRFTERFEREARAISSLNHPHICALYDIGREDSVEFLVMEYLEGESLEARLRKGPLPID